MILSLLLIGAMLAFNKMLSQAIGDSIDAELTKSLNLRCSAPGDHGLISIAVSRGLGR